ncbi:uncharacterized protein TM35_000041550 [Trypanosoma theileri]|uniref:Uncharacterized protein n=1 Tax=Trypanosoma theileri TaxID=67003 RepID=A0A1X0P528_9TRYP|nr:uncharacterized protein TM35_000041550 [Trypanosoma theileri]ORC91941.1 hypothetical protein TM35_000041550 [Trypanosoma theileri]
MSVFKRPHLRACEDYADISVELSSLRQLQSYADFEQLVRKELEEVYGAAPAQFRDSIAYSTREFPEDFSAFFTEHQLQMLQKYDASVEKAQELSRAYQAAEEEHQRTLEEGKDRKLTQKRLREQEKAEKLLRAMNREVLQAEYDVAVLEQKLRNVFAIGTIRVPLG